MPSKRTSSISRPCPTRVCCGPPQPNAVIASATQTSARGPPVHRVPAVLRSASAGRLRKGQRVDMREETADHDTRQADERGGPSRAGRSGGEADLEPRPTELLDAWDDRGGDAGAERSGRRAAFPPGRICSGSGGLSESFFATLETELIHRPPRPTRAAVRHAVHGYIGAFYNGKRRPSSLAHQSPMDLESAFHETEAMAA